MKVPRSVLERMRIAFRPAGLSRVVPPSPTLFRGGAFWFCLFSCCRRRRDSRHVAGCACPSQRRDSAPLWRVQPAHQVDGPGSFESTSTSCVPLDAPEPADEPAEKPACHARRSISERVPKEKSYTTAFLASHMSSCCILDRTPAAISLSFKVESHLQ